MSEQTTPTAAEQYLALAEQCAGFDLETRKLVKKMQDDAKQFIKDRAVLRADLLKKKLEASIQMRADEEAAKLAPPATVVIETPGGVVSNLQPGSDAHNTAVEGLMPEGWEPPGITDEERPLWLAGTPEQRQHEFERWEKAADGTFVLKNGEEEDDEHDEDPVFAGHKLSDLAGKTDAEILEIKGIGKPTLKKIRDLLAKRA